MAQLVCDSVSSGTIAGQLVILRRVNSVVVGKEGFAVLGFEAFCDAAVCSKDSSLFCDGAVGRKDSSLAGYCRTTIQREVADRSEKVCHGENNGEVGLVGHELQQLASRDFESARSFYPRALKGFFAMRPRGVLRIGVTARLPDHCRGHLTVMNTHLPHMSDNAMVLSTCAALTELAAKDGAVIFAGDLNPLPDSAVDEQIAALLEAGNTRAQNASNCDTWDLLQPLTRKEACTPRTMQLDFLLTQPQRVMTGTGSTAPSCKSKSTPSIALIEGACSRGFRPEAFLVKGLPLSDHIGLLTSMTVRLT